MYFYAIILIIIALLQSSVYDINIKTQNCVHFSNSWIVSVPRGRNMAEQIAKHDSFEIKEEIPGLIDMFHFYQPKQLPTSKYRNIKLTKNIMSNPNVLWAEQLVLRKIELKVDKNIMCPNPNHAEVLFRYQKLLNDKSFPNMWYLHDCRESKASGSVNDLNVVPVWHELKIFGYGVKVIVIDDGIDTTHEDLLANYDKRYSWDFIDNDDTPDHNPLQKDLHGTKCAGVIAMQADNKVCGVGIAPFVTLGAIRLISNHDYNSELNFYKALTYKMEDVHIMNNSYGLPDDGKSMDNIGPLINIAFKQGVFEGRQKKGIIYVFPSGNGKNSGDMCGADSFVNSIYTIVIGGADHNGRMSTTAERCSSIMATAYSGDVAPYSIVSILGNQYNKCTEEFNGTSASTAIVSGAIALVLEANPNLTWREVQYILAWTCQVAPLQRNYGWYRNAAGFWLNHNFGFGMINVYNMVILAQSFQRVPPMATCVIRFELNQPQIFSRFDSLEVIANTEACKSQPSEINYIEHVQLQVDFMHPKRGNVEILLTSPSDTMARLLETRFKDTFPMRVKNWTFDSIRTWGEAPRGKWKVTFSDKRSKYNAIGMVYTITLIIYGTKEKPALYKKPRSYYEFDILEE